MVLKKMNDKIPGLLKRNTKIEKELFSLMETLFPICRSITGNGVRQTLKILKKRKLI